MDTLPRVPDTHGDTVDEKVFSDLYIRTSWYDATIALDQIEKVSLKLVVLEFWELCQLRTYLYENSISPRHLLGDLLNNSQQQTSWAPRHLGIGLAEVVLLKSPKNNTSRRR